MTGRIIRGVGGFYFVHDGEHLYQCRAKGIFRLNHEKPLVGDRVEFSTVLDSEIENAGNIDRILPRTSRLVRPELANVNRIFLVFSVRMPEPNFDMLNRYLCMVHDTEIPVTLVVNKCDLAGEGEIERITEAFAGSGYPMHLISVYDNTGVEALREMMEGQFSCLAGPSGVGKSSLMNLLLKDEMMETGALSRKIGRGKNTTRHSEIFCLGGDSYLCDTPGFTSVDVSFIEKEELDLYFNEFVPYLPNCRYLRSCSHIREKECAVRDAASEGRIARERYESYVRIYETLAQIRRY